MKNNFGMTARKMASLMLTFVLMLSMLTPAFASWTEYDATARVTLKQTWNGTKQTIACYSGGKLVRTATALSNNLWIDNQQVLNTMYDTTYWCYDKDGNIFAIDSGRKLLLCRAGSTSFVVNTKVSACQGFQRDKGSVGYLLYTDYGTYSLDSLLNDATGSDSNDNVEELYPYVEKLGYCYYYHVSESKAYTYFLNDSNLYYLGTKGTESNTKMATGVQEITFTRNGYLVYANTNGSVYAYPVGRAASSQKKNVGNNFSYFDGSEKISKGYYNTSGTYQAFTGFSGSSYSGDYYYDYNYDYNYQTYPYVEKSGNYYYYYTSLNKYYQYYLSGSTLYYKGVNSSSSSSSITLATGVKDITFTSAGYVVYANSSNYVYAYPVGNTSSSYKETVGRNFSYFVKNSYMSEGYYTTSGVYNNFSEYNDYEYEYGEYPYVEKSGNYYYYYTSSNKYYKYALSGSNLHYYGTNNGGSAVNVAMGVKKVTFTRDGFVLYVNTDNEVNGFPVGKASSSYKQTYGVNFSYFDEKDYMSKGYYTTSGRYREFSGYNDYEDEGYPYVEKSGNYYYYYISFGKYYKYSFNGSTLYYYGTNSSSTTKLVASAVRDITFSREGYVVYANTSDYVYAYEIGETSSSYREFLGRSFEYFDGDDYMSEGYYDSSNDFNWFDF